MEPGSTPVPGMAQVTAQRPRDLHRELIHCRKRNFKASVSYTQGLLGGIFPSVPLVRHIQGKGHVLPYSEELTTNVDNLSKL